MSIVLLARGRHFPPGGAAPGAASCPLGTDLWEALRGGTAHANREHGDKQGDLKYLEHARLISYYPVFASRCHAIDLTDDMYRASLALTKCS